jgi:hypothetical protein
VARESVTGGGCGVTRKRTMSCDQQADVANGIKEMLRVSLRDQMRNGEGKKWRVSEPSYCEAFGMVRCLVAMGYGEFGPRNDANDPRNLSTWFESLCTEVMAEDIKA